MDGCQTKIRRSIVNVGWYMIKHMIQEDLAFTPTRKVHNNPLL